jgi:hypothetical protein
MSGIALAWHREADMTILTQALPEIRLAAGSRDGILGTRPGMYSRATQVLCGLRGHVYVRPADGVPAFFSNVRSAGKKRLRDGSTSP